MKKTLFATVLAIAALMFTSCEDEQAWYLPESLWIIHSEGMTSGKRLSLMFEGTQLQAQNGDSSTPPFYDETWDYYIDGDDIIHISRYVYDDETEYFSMPISLSDDGMTLSISYSPWLGKKRTYTFDRR